MPENRILPLEAPYTADVESMLARTVPPDWPGEKPLALFRTLVRHEALAAAFFGFGSFFVSRRRERGSLLDLRSRELVIGRVTARAGCAYEWGVHITLFAGPASLTPEQIAALAGRKDDADWSARDRALLAAVDELEDRARLDETTWRALATHYEENAILEILLLAGWYRAIAYLANGAGVPLESWAAPLPAGTSPVEGRQSGT